LASQQPPENQADDPHSAQGLREQAAACRRLAAAALTSAGNSSMNALADHFDEQAQSLDPTQRVEIISPETAVAVSKAAS
jgi:hypothetical protein